MLKRKTEIAIIGGGIWGLSTAFHLAKLGRKKVTLFERNAELARETTPRASGLVGQIRSTRVMMHAVRYATELFNDLPNVGFRQTGSLLIALTDERMKIYEDQIAIAKAHDIEADFVDLSEIRRLTPHIETSKIRGGYFVPKDGNLDPRTCAMAYASAAKNLGVDLRTETEIVGLIAKEDQIIAIETADEIIEVDQAIITAGPWSGVLTKKLGIPLAMQPIRHQRVITEQEGVPKHHPVVRVPDTSCYVREENGSYLYGFFEPDPTSIDPEGITTDQLEPPIEVMNEAKNRLSPIYPILEDLKIAERWQGLTTFAADSSYLIGQMPNFENLFVASGCAALGIAGSAAVGKWLANWATHGNPDEDLSMFDPQRFGDLAKDPDRLKREAEHCYANYYAIRPTKDH